MSYKERLGKLFGRQKRSEEPRGEVIQPRKYVITAEDAARVVNPYGIINPGRSAPGEEFPEGVIPAQYELTNEERAAFLESVRNNRIINPRHSIKDVTPGAEEEGK